MEIGDTWRRSIVHRLHELRVTLTQVSLGELREDHVRGNLGCGCDAFHQRRSKAFKDGPGPGTVPERLRVRQDFKHRFKYWKFRLQAEYPPRTLIGMFGTPLKDQFRNVHPGRTNRA